MMDKPRDQHRDHRPQLHVFDDQFMVHLTMDFLVLAALFRAADVI